MNVPQIMHAHHSLTPFATLKCLVTPCVYYCAQKRIGRLTRALCQSDISDGDVTATGVLINMAMRQTVHDMNARSDVCCEIAR